MARIVKESFSDTAGKEAGLAVVARVFLVLGILAVLLSIALVIVRGEFFWLALGGLSMVFGSACYMIFNALSEIIALLKRLCGIPCNAVISGTKTGTVYLCSDCGSMTWQDAVKCERCGAEFTSEDGSGGG